MHVSMSRLILYVHDVSRLKTFYQASFSFKVREEIEGEWVVLDAGAVELAFHRVGVQYRDREPAQQSHSNSKIVLSIRSGLLELRNKLLAEGVPMRDVKRYEGFPYLMCDGEDPEGNVFQLMEMD
ncbi:hypothetical protein DYGSA30_36560 [Dyella sp. GSA-30]|nr:hypothetical protein DYGSA30_36560 [Dyella sp. GSA-30]